MSWRWRVCSRQGVHVSARKFWVEDDDDDDDDDAAAEIRARLILIAISEMEDFMTNKRERARATESSDW